jgi:hypothetical protein
LVVIETWWRAIGDEVTAAWERRGRTVESFAEIAEQVLAAHPAPDGSVAGPALAWLASSALPDQHDPVGGFGQPALTVYRGDGFIVSLLFWVHESVTIHDHRFTGAFSIVDGASLHSRYEFEPRCRHHADFESGVLTPVDVEVLRRGTVRAIVAGPKLIHSNFHFAAKGPGLSIVVRTVGQPLATQRFYSRSGLAFTDAMRAPAVTMRLGGLSAAAHISRDTGVAYLTQALADASPAEVMVYLGAGMMALGTAVVPPLLAASCLPGYTDVEFRVLQYMEQLAHSMRVVDQLERVTDPTEQTVLAAVAAGSPWREVAQLVGSDEEVNRVVRSLAGDWPSDDGLLTHPVFGSLFRSRL